jgi:hypothetical protein
VEQADRVARHLAASGAAEIARIRDIVARAQHMVDESGFLTDPEVQRLTPPPRFPWERVELFPVGAELAVYQAMAETDATGEGIDLHYMAGLARSEDELRRRFAASVGPTLADTAMIVRGAAMGLPHSDLFVSPQLRALLDQAEQGDHRPAVLALDAHLHLNAS